MLKDLLENNKCFKLVCGAGNENVEEVKNLVKLYYAAGCRFFDLSMNENVVKVAKETAPDAYFSISFGIKGDPHFNKARINKNNCRQCAQCVFNCPQGAVSAKFEIDEKLCIGCMKCKRGCNFNAIESYAKNKELPDVLPQLLKYNPDCIELHAIGDDEIDVDEKWNYIADNYKGIMSVCIDRSKLGNERVLARINRLIQNREPYTTIVQADGAPMSGGEDDLKTTLQAVAMAEIIQNAKLPVYLLLSGGTNSKTLAMAKDCGILPNGIAIGSYARKIVKSYLERPDFNDEKIFAEAVQVAKNLIEKSIS